MVYTVPAPQMSGMLGATPRDSAIASMNQKNDILTSLVNVGGKRRHKRSGSHKRSGRRGGAAGVVVAQPPGLNLVNDPSAGTSQSIANQITTNASQINQSGANAAFDSKVVLAPIPPPPVRGGKKSRKLKKSRKSRKSRKSKKSRKSRKSKK